MVVIILNKQDALDHYFQENFCRKFNYNGAYFSSLKELTQGLPVTQKIFLTLTNATSYFHKLGW